MERSRHYAAILEGILGVTFSADMKVSDQCRIAASKGNQMLGLIRRTITCEEKQLIVPLYKAIVRPHMEYCIQACRPCRKKDIDIARKNTTKSNNGSNIVDGAAGDCSVVASTTKRFESKMGHMMLVILVTLLIVMADHCTSGRPQYLEEKVD